MIREFLVHGKTNISIENNILILKSTGPWNAEYFHRLHQELLIKASEINIDNYGILLIPYGEAIGTPEAMDSHMSMVQQGRPKAVAVNLSQCDTPKSTASLCSITYKTAALTFDFFDSNEQAKAWLQTQLN